MLRFNSSFGIPLRLLGTCCSALLLLAAVCSAQTSREAVPEINEFGWKFLMWGQSPQDVQSTFAAQQQTFAPRELRALDLLTGFDAAWRPLEITATALGRDTRFLATDFNDAVLIFRNNRLFGVQISRSSPQHLQDSLFQAMVKRYPEGRSLRQGPGRSRFQHTVGNRRIVWDARPSGFTLSFFEPETLAQLGSLTRVQAGAVTAEPFGTPALGSEYAASSQAVTDSAPRFAAASATPQAPEHGAQWQDPGTGLRFVYLQGGCFRRSPQEAETCVAPFWIGTREVTAGQFQGGQGELPAAGMTCLQARDYAAHLSAQRPGTIFDLPTEQQWEYAARAGLGAAAPWPSGESACQWGNVADQSSGQAAGFPCNDGHSGAAPVGSFPANAWGLHDTLGNVWEWCLGPGGECLACGGSHGTPAAEAGFGARLSSPPAAGRQDIGLRLLLMQQDGGLPGTGGGYQTGPATPPTPQVGKGSRPAIEDLM